MALLTAYLAMSLLIGFAVTKPKRIARITLRIGNPPGGAR